MIREDINLEKLEIHINNLLKKDIYKDKIIECCPSCNCKNFIKYGKYKEIQRYKCSQCGKTFSKSTNSLWSYSKHTPSKWIEFLELLLEKKSLRFCASKLKISLPTAFYWRHKILYSLTLDSLPHNLKGDIHIGKTLLLENFKGSRDIQTPLRRNVWIVGAKGTDDSMLIKPISIGQWNSTKFNENIYSKIEKKSYIIPYGDRYICCIAKFHNNNLIKKIDPEDRIGLLRRNLNEWLKRFCGIATKYLDEYLSLFILFNLDKEISYMDLINSLGFGHRFIKTKKIGLFHTCLF